MYARFAIRDGVLIAAALGFWWLAAGLSAGEGALGDFTGFVAGLLLGAVAYVLHEWGHLLAAFAVGAALAPGRNLRSGFMFSFSAEDNSLRQFVAMSLGGFAATAAVVWSFYAFLPDALLATHVARGAVLFLAFLGVTLELPLLIAALVKGGVPTAAAVKLSSS